MSGSKETKKHFDECYKMAAKRGFGEVFSSPLLFTPQI
jgi:hypothetical protein